MNHACDTALIVFSVRFKSGSLKSFTTERFRSLSKDSLVRATFKIGLTRVQDFDHCLIINNLVFVEFRVKPSELMSSLKPRIP